MHVEAHAEETLQFSERSSAVLYDLNGNIKQRSDSETSQKNTNPQKLNESKVTVKWFFSEYPNEEAIVICEKFLKLMKSFKDSIAPNVPIEFILT